MNYFKQKKSQLIEEAANIRKNYIEIKTQEFEESSVLDPKMFQILRTVKGDFSRMPEQVAYFHHDLVLCAGVKIMQNRGIDIEKFFKMPWGKLKEDIDSGKFSIDKIKELIKEK